MDAYSAVPPCPDAEAPRASPAVDPQDWVSQADAAVEPAPMAHRARWASQSAVAAATEYWEYSERPAAVPLDQQAQQLKALWAHLRLQALAAWVRIGSGQVSAREQASLELPNHARPHPVTMTDSEAPESTVLLAREQRAAEPRAAAKVSKAAKKFVLPIKERRETKAA